MQVVEISDAAIFGFAAFGIYALGVYIAFVIGGLSKRKGIEFDESYVAFAILWPILLFAIPFVFIGSALGSFSRKHKRIMTFINRACDIATLPFRPFTIGSRLSEWRRNRKRGAK